MTPKVYSQEERLMAALSHGSILVSGMGIMVAAIVWLTQKEKYPYAAAQAKQATVYQLLTMGFVVASWLVWGILYAIILAILIPQNPDALESGWGFWFLMVSWIVPLVLMFFWWIYGIWGAVRTWQGRNFRYPLIGRLMS